MQVLQIFNEFAWLVHMGILDGVKKKIKFKAFVEQGPWLGCSKRAKIS